jgi:hypothetical protein
MGAGYSQLWEVPPKVLNEPTIPTGHDESGMCRAEGQCAEQNDKHRLAMVNFDIQKDRC